MTWSSCQDAGWCTTRWEWKVNGYKGIVLLPEAHQFSLLVMRYENQNVNGTSKKEVRRSNGYKTEEESTEQRGVTRDQPVRWRRPLKSESGENLIQGMGYAHRCAVSDLE